jgi:hypothetical protein
MSGHRKMPCPACTCMAFAAGTRIASVGGTRIAFVAGTRMALAETSPVCA